ncbi:B12-binding domain-containing radical SAM protein [Patescibacteria group bacterium]|nr:B12-binding domain-containing radical SAM protein [Patescibacteria group bacterium]MBU4511776.1 B12-binding domain-containing radical SAM protein [Patescibacteria group bacterium]MCG2692915.1 B12-binding domain-containing radical SAM protein [Candidatus Parcubacteria bacterium]
MKILFLYKQVEYIDPMGIMLLSALAKRAGHETFLNVLADNNLEESLSKIKPDIVAASAKTGEHKYYIEAFRRIKKNSPTTITNMGGPHPTFFPEIINEPSLDVIIIGEGDEAWVELLRALENKNSVERIDNVYTKEMKAQGREPVLRFKKINLDDLPFYDRDLLYKNTRLGRFPMRSFMVSRGCPYHCTYCFNHVYNEMYKNKGPIVTRMGVDRIIAELKNLKEKYETQFIKFYDDNFVLADDEWLTEFSEKYPKEIGLPFHCLMRANNLTESILLKLKKAGLVSISMSIEAANDRLRNEIFKRGMTKEEIFRAFLLCHKHKIPTFCNTIFGIPTGNIKNDIESLDLNLECKVTFGEFPIFYPYPRTHLGEYAKQKGLFDGDFDKLHMSYQAGSPLNCFSEQEKLQQMNLSLLGTVVLKFPWLRNLTVKHLINWRLTKLYFVAYYLTKAYLIKTKIYPMKFSLGNTLRSVYESFILEKFKHTSEKTEK